MADACPSPPGTPLASHLHTYFLFAFSVDKEAVLEDHRDIWRPGETWFDRLDTWLSVHHNPGEHAVVNALGAWQRAPYRRFDMESRAYQDMVFFHPFVRRVFFDTDAVAPDEADHEALLRCYVLPIPPQAQLTLVASDALGRTATVDVKDLRLFLFANGIGVLSIGVEASRLPIRDALWINEMMRKVYPTSGRQVREGRLPNVVRLVMTSGGESRTILEENFRKGTMVSFQPPLSRLITGLLYFVDYSKIEFEPVLDERMIVYTFLAVDPSSVPPDFVGSPACEVLLSRLLYVDRDGPGFRYQPAFVRRQMRQQVYRRWAHQGTYYGFTSYSSVTMTMGTFDCDEHTLREGFLIYRMFDTRYYLMAIVALFYRVTLLDFNERTALVSRRLYRDQHDGRVTPENVRLASALRAEFLHFSNYWFFEELANKDEEIEHFDLQAEAYRLGPMKAESEREIEALNASLEEYNQRNNTAAVNRLAMLSTILGAGAVLTGYFGMNFAREFGELFFEPVKPHEWSMHWAMIILVTLFAFSALVLGFYLILANWNDYKDTLVPKVLRRKKPLTRQSLKRVRHVTDPEVEINTDL